MNRTESIRLFAADAGNWFDRRFLQESRAPRTSAEQPSDLKLAAMAGSAA